MLTNAGFWSQAHAGRCCSRRFEQANPSVACSRVLWLLLQQLGRQTSERRDYQSHNKWAGRGGFGEHGSHNHPKSQDAEEDNDVVFH